MCVYPDTIVPPAHVKNISQADNATRNFGWVRPDTTPNKEHKHLGFTLNSGDRNQTEITSHFNSLLPIQYLTRLFSSAAILSPWSTAAPSPISRFEAGNAVVNNKLYIFGGYVKPLYHATKRSDVYNPATNMWTQLPSLPSPITHAGVAVDGNTIYLAGGYVGDAPGISGTAKVFKYNVTTNTWSLGRSLPEARGAGGLVVLGRELHFFGGHNVDRTQDKGSHWVFNLDNGTEWKSKAPLPNPRNHFGYTVDNDQIYVIGGQYLKDDKFRNQSDVHVYNRLTDTWRKVASLPTARSHNHTSTFVRNGKIIIVGGRANGSTRPILADVTEYNPTLNQWTELSPLPEARQAAAAKLINNQIVVTTGAASGDNPQATTWLGGG